MFVSSINLKTIIMKKTLLFFSMILTLGLSANAQCTPDPQYTAPGVYPDSATGFMPACVDTLYEQLITNIVPVDTTTMVGPIPVTLVFDSVIITSVTGLPPGFTYSCFDGQNVTSPVDQCAFEGGTTGCVLITGTPTAADIGVYNLNIITEAYLGGISTPQATVDVDYYSIEVLDPNDPYCSVGISENEKSKFKLFPNPVSESFTLDGLDGINVSEISITNTEGKVLRSFLEIHSPSFELNVSDFDAGIYFVRIVHGTSSEVIRFIKE